MRIKEEERREGREGRGRGLGGRGRRRSSFPFLPAKNEEIFKIMDVLAIGLGLVVAPELSEARVGLVEAVLGLEGAQRLHGGAGGPTRAM